jgi:hypothetical protein
MIDISGQLDFAMLVDIRPIPRVRYEPHQGQPGPFQPSAGMAVVIMAVVMAADTIIDIRLNCSSPITIPD